MVVERDEFFAELDGLTEKEIEARLDLWDREQLTLIQEYLDQRVLVRAKAEQAAQIKAAPSAQDAVAASLAEVANTANTKATAALILSVGAMLAAIASALVAFLALRGWTISWYRLGPRGSPAWSPALIVLTQLPMGVVYAVWAGMGIALVAIIGWAKPLTSVQVLCITLIVAGAIGLSLSTPVFSHAPTT